MVMNSSIAVIGSGISGLCSSIFLSKLFNIKVDLYSESNLGKSSSIMAQSGFRAGNGNGGEVIFNNELENNFKIYFEDWLIDLFRHLPEAISYIDIDLSSMKVSNKHLDKLNGLPMYSLHQKNIGVELVKHLIKEVKKEELISVYENTLVNFEDEQNSVKEINKSIFGTNLRGQKFKIRNKYIILAIGGDVGSGIYESSSNMTYQSYKMHQILFDDVNERKVQFHPFGLKKGKKSGPVKCLPEILAKNGDLIYGSSNKKMSINNFNSRKDCVNWMNNKKEKIYLIPSPQNIDYIRKRFKTYLINTESFGEVVEVFPVAHYLLSTKQEILNNKFLRVGECKTNGFKLDRPAGMGITQSILTSFDAASKFAQNYQDH